MGIARYSFLITLGLATLIALAACATGPAAGWENAPAPTGLSATPGPALAPATAAAQQAPLAPAPVGPVTSEWQLTDLTVFYQGNSAELPEGTLVSNYVLNGRAVAPEGLLVKEGEFQLVLGAFWPNKDLPGQPAGSWYINGNWTITDPTVPTPTVRQRQPPGVISGVLVTRLDTDPTRPGQALTLPVTLPISRVNGVWARGSGSLQLDPDRSGGTLTLVLDRRAP